MRDHVFEYLSFVSPSVAIRMRALDSSHPTAAAWIRNIVMATSPYPCVDAGGWRGDYCWLFSAALLQAALEGPSATAVDRVSCEAMAFADQRCGTVAFDDRGAWNTSEDVGFGDVFNHSARWHGLVVLAQEEPLNMERLLHIAHASS